MERATGLKRASLVPVLVLSAIVPLWATWTYEQDFDALSTGVLHGQDSWTGTNAAGRTDYMVQTSVVSQGTKAISVPITTHATIVRALPAPISSGDFFVDMRKTHNTGSDLYTLLQDGGDVNRIYIRMGADGNISAYDDGTYVSLGTYSANTWYRINIQFDDSSSPDRFRVRVKTGSTWGSWSAWFAVNGGSYNNMMKLVFQTEGDGSTLGHVGYFDGIAATD